MARTWYQLSAGPAPWADATSYSASSTYYSSNSILQDEGSSNSISYKTDLNISITSSASASGTQYNFGGDFSSTQAGARGYTYVLSAGLVSYTSTLSNSGSHIFGGVTRTQSETGSTAYGEVYLSGFYASGNNTFNSGRTLATLGTAPSSTSVGSTTIFSGLYVLVYGTREITTSYLASPQSSNYVTTASAAYDSDFDPASYVIISTALTSGIGTDTTTYASTNYTTTNYTYLTVTYLTRAGFSYTPQTTSYLRGAFHEIPVISAAEGEILRLQTATGSNGVSGQADILGASFLQTTLNSAIYSGSSGTPYATTNSTRTVTSSAISYGTLTITVSSATYITLTQQQFNGWIGGTTTQLQYVYGVTTTTRTQRTGAVVTATRTNNAARGYTTYGLVQLTSFLSENISGINSVGASAAYAVVASYLAPLWISYVDYTGNPGETVTTKKSPSTPFGHSGGGAANVTRIERAGGYQSPHDMGSAGAQGKSVSAASSFYIGANNLGTGSPANLRVPFLTYGSTAATSNSVYSFSFGPTNCSVTAATTDSSSSTVTTFTASISVAGAANSFNSNSPSGQTLSRTVAGGAHAWTGGQQNATLGDGYGWRYTLGDSLGTTSFRETRTVFIATSALGSSIIAAETFKAGVPSPLLAAGLPNVLIFAYSAP